MHGLVAVVGVQVDDRDDHKLFEMGGDNLHRAVTNVAAGGTGATDADAIRRG